MTPPYADPPTNNGIIRPKRPLTPQQSAALAQQLGAYRAPPIATAAPIIAAPAARNLNLADAPIPDAPDTSAAPQPVADAAGATAMSAPALKPADAPGTRHGLGGRIKDFLEAAMYGLAQDQGQHGRYGGLMSGLGAGMAAAAKPGALAQYKWNNIEQPRIDERDARVNQQEALKQQGILRAAQARKAQGDVDEDVATRADRMRQMRAQTGLAEANATLAGANATKALRPGADRVFHPGGAWHQERGTDEWIYNEPGQPSFRSGTFGQAPPPHTGANASDGSSETTEDIFGYPAGSQTREDWQARQQEANTALDSQVNRGELDPGAATAMKLQWVQHNPMPHPVKTGERKSKSISRPQANATSRGGGIPAGTDAATAQRYAAWRAAKGLP